MESVVSTAIACMDDKTKLMGQVTTNSMLYDPGALKFEDGSLTYRVAGAHLVYDGSVFKGTYDLAKRSETARCLHDFSSAPIKASVSITSGDGTTQDIATEVVNERDGWLSLSAKNFTFSSPTIRIKLSQDAPLVAPSPTTSATAAKKVTIACVEGKLTKKVTAVKPVCPKGYKKK